MKTTKMWLVAMMFLAFAAVSCDNDDDEDPVVESEVLVEYLESADGGDYANTAMPAIKTAEYVKNGNTAGTVYLIDIRRPDDFAKGHVENAVNLTAAEVIPHLEESSDDDGLEVILICYSGQSAAWLTNMLRVSGYTNAYSMKFGMCSWHNDFAGSWPNNVSNKWASSFEDGNVEKGEKGDMPSLNTGETDGEAILKARIDDVIAEGFGAAAVSSDEVFGNLDQYYIVNYWGVEDYNLYGHIPGAMQYTPKASIAVDADLKTLPTDKTVVVYCWTGQTSANMAAYLRLLGYDAKSLTFGANGMIYDELEKGKWTNAAIMGYEYVVPE